MPQEFNFQTVVIAFNRPDYLKKVLSSLAMQTLRLNSKKLIFCIDGFINSYHYQIGSTNNQELLRKYIIKAFPDSMIISEEVNIGIPRMHRKALDLAFLDGSDWALILEDDVYLRKEALFILQEYILNDGGIPSNTGIINLDCWKRIDFKFKTVSYTHLTLPTKA